MILASAPSRRRRRLRRSRRARQNRKGPLEGGPNQPSRRRLSGRPSSICRRSSPISPRRRTPGSASRRRSCSIPRRCRIPKPCGAEIADRHARLSAHDLARANSKGRSAFKTSARISTSAPRSARGGKVKELRHSNPGAAMKRLVFAALRCLAGRRGAHAQTVDLGSLHPRRRRLGDRPHHQIGRASSPCCRSRRAC